MTAFAGVSMEEALASNIVSELQREEKNSSAEFVIKEIQLIHAEVFIFYFGGVSNIFAVPRILCTILVFPC